MTNNRRKTLIQLPLVVLTLMTLACTLMPQDAPSRPVDLPIEVDITGTPVEQTNVSEIPTSTSTPELAAEPTAVATDTPEVIDNSPFNPPAIEAGACANPFYPMVPGYQWVYQINSPTETSQVGLTVTEIQGDQAKLNAVYLETGIVTELTVDCRDGEILNFPTILLSFIFGDIGGSIDVVHVDGIYAPNFDYLAEHLSNAEWSGEYLANGEISAEVEGEQYLGTLNESPLEMNWQVIPNGEEIYEMIDVSAGHYENAIRVNSSLPGERSTLSSTVWASRHAISAAISTALPSIPSRTTSRLAGSTCAST